MSLSIEIQKKPNVTENRKITKTSEVFELEEVQEIKNAVQEHLLFIGLDRANNIRNVSIIGVGTNSRINIDSKYIVRTALVTASDKVILVHNHPSNNLEPSDSDKHITNETSKMLKAFNVQFVDHIIVTEETYISMESIKKINRDYENDKTELIDKVLLIEENNRLKEKNRILSNKLQRYEKLKKEEEEEYE